jgi:hypothetical protein
MKWLTFLLTKYHQSRLASILPASGATRSCTRRRQRQPIRSPSSTPGPLSIYHVVVVFHPAVGMLNLSDRRNRWFLSGPVRFPYNPYFSTCFFKQNSIFLSQQISKQYFQSWFFSEANELSVFTHSCSVSVCNGKCRAQVVATRHASLA